MSGCVVTVLIGLALEALLALPSGFALMLAVGVVHHEWIPASPTIGFWWAVLLAFLLRGALYTPDTSKD